MDPAGGPGGRAGGLEDLLPCTERIDLGPEPLTDRGKFLLLAPEDRKPMAQARKLLLDPGLAGLRVPGQVLSLCIERVRALPGELRGALLELIDLQLDALARGRHVGDTAAHRLQSL